MFQLTTSPCQPPRPPKYVKTCPWWWWTLPCPHIWAPWSSSPSLPTVCTFTKIAHIVICKTRIATHAACDWLATCASLISTFCKKNHGNPRRGCGDINFFVHLVVGLSQITWRKSGPKNRCRRRTLPRTPVKIYTHLIHVYAHILTCARRV